jgi:hypothetical protein
MPDDVSLAAPNGLDPARMSADERLAEVAEILAAGLLRLRERRRAESGNRRESSLDFPARQSVHGPRARVGGRR